MMAKEVKVAKEKKKKEETAPQTQKVGQEKVYSVRGNIFEGKVVSAKAQKTVTVERSLTHYLSKYERYKKIKSKIKAHNPESINAKEGDIVQVGETRKISKTKSFIVMKILSRGEQK